MQITTASLIVNPCDDEYDDMALLCCHSERGELFSLTRFPDENEVEITCDEEVFTVSNLTVTFSAEHLVVEVTPDDGMNQDDRQVYEIRHATSADDLREVEETLQIILENVGTYVSKIA